MYLAATIFASIGLLFIGLRLMSAHIRLLVGPRTRGAFDRVLSGGGSAALFGALAGAVMQSVNAVAMLLAALVSAGVTEPRKVFPIIGWANIGTSVLVLAATLDIKLLALLLAAFTGVAYYLNLDQSPKYRHLIGALLGITLLLLGISLMKQGVANPEHQYLLAEIAATAGRYYFLNFVVGVALAFLVHSATTVTVIVTAMVTSGVLQADHAGMIVVGATLGSALSVWVLAARLAGSARQIMVYQFLLKCCGVAAVLPVTIIDIALDEPLFSTFNSMLGNSPSLVLAVLYLVIQVASDVIMHLAHRPLVRLVERLAPPSMAERLSRPMFLSDDALPEPATALILLDKEQTRLIERLPRYLDALRPEATAEGPDARTRAEADKGILVRCDQFLKEIADRNHSRELLERTMMLRDRNELIESLQETLVELTEVGRLSGTGEEPGIDDAILESLHMMLETFADATRARDEEDLAVLHELTRDRSGMMENIRHQLAGDGGFHDPVTHRKLMAFTSLFERAVWLLRRQVRLLGRLDRAVI